MRRVILGCVLILMLAWAAQGESLWRSVPGEWTDSNQWFDANGITLAARGGKMFPVAGDEANVAGTILSLTTSGYTNLDPNDVATDANWVFGGVGYVGALVTTEANGVLVSYGGTWNDSNLGIANVRKGTAYGVADALVGTLLIVDPNITLSSVAGGTWNDSNIGPGMVRVGVKWGVGDVFTGTLVGAEAARHTVYASLTKGDGNDSLTWAAAQDPNYPVLTLNRVLVLAATNTAIGDTVVVKVDSNTARTAQCLVPAWDTAPVVCRKFRFEPWRGALDNADGHWYANGPDATQIGFVQPSVVQGDPNIACELTFYRGNIAAGASTTRIIHRDAGSTGSLKFIFDECVVSNTGGGFVAGTGTAGKLDLVIRNSTLTLANTFVPATAGVTAVSIERSTVSQTAGEFLDFSASSKLGDVFLSDSNFTTGTTSTKEGMDFTNIEANSLVIRGCRVEAADSNGACLVLVNDSGATTTALCIERNRLLYTGTGTNQAVLRCGVGSDGNTRADQTALLNSNWSTPVIRDNTLVQTHASGGVLWVQLGLTGAEVRNNIVIGPKSGSGHTFQAAANNVGVYGNYVYGCLPYMHFGDGIDANGNTFVQTGTSAGVLLGSPAGTGWEPGAGGSVRWNTVVQLGTGPTLSDYSNGALGIWDVSTLVDYNTYIRADANAQLYVRGAGCITIADANTRWNLMADPNVYANDSHSSTTVRGVGGPEILTTAGGRYAPPGGGYGDPNFVKSPTTFGVDSNRTGSYHVIERPPSPPGQMSLYQTPETAFLVFAAAYSLLVWVARHRRRTT